MRPLRPLLLALSLLFATVQAFANEQFDEVLAVIDSQIVDIQREPDDSKHSYDLQLWKDRVLRIFTAVDDSSLASYPFQHLRRIASDPSVQAFYFLEQRSQSITLLWLAKPVGHKPLLFADPISPLPLADSLRIETQTHGHLHGFRVLQGSSQLFAVPDIRLRLAFETIADVRLSGEEKDAAQSYIESSLDELLTLNDPFQFDLSGLPRLSHVADAKHTFRIVTYMVSYSNFQSTCHGRIFRQTEKGIRVEHLNDQRAKISASERVKLTPKKWLGAVYNSLIELKVGKQTYYTLLGFVSNDGLVKTRTIEVLWFSGQRTYFGAPIFEHEKTTYSRRLFRYSADANMLLRYDDRLQMIVFDHLSPSSPMFTGEYRLYGPDFTHDGYKKTRKGWSFHSDIDVRNE